MSGLSENLSFDVEAQEARLPAVNQLCWKLYLVIRSAECFISIGANIDSSSTASDSYYSAMSTDDDDEESKPLTADIQLLAGDYQDTQTVASLEVTEESDEENISSTIVHATSEHEHNNIELQSMKKNITEIVKLKNLQKLHSFGGVSGVARILNTDLKYGMSSDVGENIILQPSGRVSIFFHCFRGSWNNNIIILLFVAAVLSLIFGIKQQGLATGWFDGAIVTLTIFLLVIFKTIRGYFRAKFYLHKKFETYNKLKARVIRDGIQVDVSAIDLRIGDLVVLERGDLVPADGLFIYLPSGEQQHLEVYGDVKGEIVNEKNPFLLYGSRVISGNSLMLVTSVGVDTMWGEIMSHAIMSSEKSCKFEVFLNNANNFIQKVGLLIGIFISTALFLRYEFGKTSNGNGFKMGSQGEGTRVNTIMNAIKGIIISGEGSKSGTSRVLTLLSISLVGLLEGIPIVISFAVLEWNRKTLAPLKALDRDSMACIKIASITSIICTDKLGELTEHEQETNMLLLDGEEFVSERSQVAPDVLESIREETKRSILALKEGGIRTILASGDDVVVLETIGQNCGMLSQSSDDDLVLTAKEYRSWSNEEKQDRIEKISIIGNCNLSDKIDLLKRLKDKGQVVAVRGQRTIDAPLLKEADIGLTFGSLTSEVAREISDIHVLDGDFFGFLVDVIKKGRCFHENIYRNIIQTQIIISISSSLINFIATVLWGDAPLTAIQLLWLNLTVALVGGLIVLTGPSAGAVLMSPFDSEQLLMKKTMWWNIAIQASYQTSVFLTLQSKGQVILGISETDVKSLIYKGFCFCQLFCMIIAKEPEWKNIFSGLHQKNGLYFCVAMCVFLFLQAVFFVADTFLGGTPWLTWKLLGVCLFIGVVSWLLDFAKKFGSNFVYR